MNDAFAACVAGYGSHSPEVLHFGPVLNVQHASRWENIVDAADLSHSTCCRLGHHQCGKASSHGEYSESSTHVQAVLPTVGLAT